MALNRPKPRLNSATIEAPDMMNARLKSTLMGAKPIFGMLHLNGSSEQSRLRLALQEAHDMLAQGVGGVIVENYFGNEEDVSRVLDELFKLGFPGLIGVNVLGNTDHAFALARQYPVDFIQIDSVCGHLPAQKDEAFARDLAQKRASVDAAIFGGVRFKYQPIASNRTEAEDVALAAERCDALVVTGIATGAQTDLSKLMRFRAAAGQDVPLIVGSGLCAQNAQDQLALADAAIVGSSFKDTLIDTGIVDTACVARVMTAVRLARA